VGGRLRAKYEQAVRQARDVIVRRNGPRGDREHLVRLLERERLLIPDDEVRRPLRQIARETGSSYGRVAECERHFSELIRQRLENDPEFGVLRRYAQACPLGVSQRINQRMERELAGVSAAEFLRRLRRAEGKDRGRMLGLLLDVTREELEVVIGDCLAALPSDDRERLFAGNGQEGEPQVRSPLRTALSVRVGD
jgi:hypothetical protein